MKTGIVSGTIGTHRYNLKPNEPHGTAMNGVAQNADSNEAPAERKSNRIRKPAVGQELSETKEHRYHHLVGFRANT